MKRVTFSSAIRIDRPVHDWFYVAFSKSSYKSIPDYGILSRKRIKKTNRLRPKETCLDLDRDLLLPRANFWNELDCVNLRSLVSTAKPRLGGWFRSTIWSVSQSVQPTDLIRLNYLNSAVNLTNITSTEDICSRQSDDGRESETANIFTNDESTVDRVDKNSSFLRCEK